MAKDRQTAVQLRTSKPEELLKKLEAARKTLCDLRVAQAVQREEKTAKLGKIKPTRKLIARILTVYNEQRRDEVRQALKKTARLPLDMRPKLTRAMRRRLTRHQLAKKPIGVKRRMQNLPQRNFAVLSN